MLQKNKMGHNSLMLCHIIDDWRWIKLAKKNEKVVLLVEELKSINKNIFFDLVIDNFNNDLLEKKFGKNWMKIQFFLREKLILLGKLMSQTKIFWEKL